MLPAEGLRPITPAWDTEAGDAHLALERIKWASALYFSERKARARELERTIAPSQAKPRPKPTSPEQYLSAEADNRQLIAELAGVDDMALPEPVKHKRPRKGPGDASTPCPTGRVLDQHECLLPDGTHYRPITRTTCHLCTCEQCERRRSGKLKEGYGPVIAKFNNPVAIVLTVANKPTAKGAVDHLITSVRHFADLRLGSRNRHKIGLKAFGFIDSLSGDRLQGRTPLQWKKAVVRWLRYVARKDNASAKPLKLRKFLKGILSLESTKGRDWHMHYHGILDLTHFLPWPVLVVCWTLATGQDTYAGAHITSMRGKDPLGELFKYSVKGLETGVLTLEDKQELLTALYNRKRIIVFGGLKPVKPEREPCPNCHGLDCRVQHMATVENANDNDHTPDAIHASDTEYTVSAGDERWHIIEYTDPERPELGLMWHVLSQASRQFPNVKTIACNCDSDPPPRLEKPTTGAYT